MQVQIQARESSRKQEKSRSSSSINPTKVQMDSSRYKADTHLLNIQHRVSRTWRVPCSLLKAPVFMDGKAARETKEAPNSPERRNADLFSLSPFPPLSPEKEEVPWDTLLLPNMVGSFPTMFKIQGGESHGEQTFLHDLRPVRSELLQR